MWSKRTLWLMATGWAALSIVVGRPSDGWAAARVCATPQDERALDARALQTELMVAALTCGEKDRYNAFVTTFQKELVAQGQSLQSLFRRAHGSQGTYQLNLYVTKLANDASQRSLAIREGYCAFASELFDEALATKPGNLNQLTAKPWLSVKRAFQSCERRSDGAAKGKQVNQDVGNTKSSAN